MWSFKKLKLINCSKSCIFVWRCLNVNSLLNIPYYLYISIFMYLLDAVIFFFSFHSSNISKINITNIFLWHSIGKWNQKSPTLKRSLASHFHVYFLSIAWKAISWGCLDAVTMQTNVKSGPIRVGSQLNKI